jgi:serine protease Do
MRQRSIQKRANVATRVLRRALSILVIAAALVAPTAAFAQGGAAEPAPGNILEQISQATESAAARVGPSVVQILVERLVVVPPARPVRETILSSGIIWDNKGHVVSLGTIFETADSVTVTLPGGKNVAAHVVAVDAETGLALLSLAPETAAGGMPTLQPAALGRSSVLRPGSVIVQVSHPFGLKGSVSLGTVAGTDRVLKRGKRALVGALQITTAVNPGDPGGALVNPRGEVVGIVASAYERGLDTAELVRMYESLLRVGEDMIERASGKEGQTDPKGKGQKARQEPPRFAGGRSSLGGQGIGFAVPIDMARPIVERMIAKKVNDRSWLGLQVLEVDDSLVRRLGLSQTGGMLVVGVVERGPAERGGLRRNDQLVKYGGEAIGSLDHFMVLIKAAPVGTAVAVEVIRDQKRVTLEITPAARPR